MKKHLLSIVFTFFGLYLTAQNVGIGTNDPKARLDITATDEGFLIPRVALTATNSASPLTTPEESELVYNTATAGTAPNDVTPGYYYWDGNKWARVANSNENNWTIENTTVTPAIKTSNQYVTGNVGIGDFSAASVVHKLHIIETGNDATISGLYVNESNIGQAVTIEESGNGQALLITESGNGTGILLTANDNGSAIISTAAGAVTAAAVGHDFFDTRTSSTNAINKIGTRITSNGSWSGTGAVNIGLDVNVSGGTTNYAALFNGGNVGIGTSAPVQRLDVNGIIAVEGKRAIQGNDSWLRINQGGDFTTGVYIPSFIRIDGGLASGALATPGSGAITASGFINSNAGFRISNAATSGHYLRGNGTNFVSSAIQPGDIPAGSGNYIQNTTTQQSGANFNISGNGTLAGTLTAGGITSSAASGGSNFLGVAGANQNWFPFTNGANYLSADNTYFRAADNTSTHVTISPKGADVLTVNGGRLRVNNSFMMQDGNQALNRVMRSNANGVASWVDMSTVIPSTNNTNGTVVIGSIRISWGVSGSSLCDNATTDISLSNFTSVYSAQLTPVGNSSADKAWPMLQVLNTSTLRVRAQTTDGSCIDGFHWMVIGLN